MAVKWLPFRLASARGAVATGARATGSAATGALAVGALAVGAVAVGALALGRLSVGRARLGRVRIGELVIDRLKIGSTEPYPLTPDIAQPLILHEYANSGNCYKIRLTAGLLGQPIERREYDILEGTTRTPEFLATVNDNGRIPVLQIGERFLPESNAACCWLAAGTDLIPADRFDHADMLRWMFWEQYSHEPNIATLKFWLAIVGEDKLTTAQRDQIAAKRAAGEDALALMERHLAGREWFVGDRPSLADICLFAYTHTAGEGGFTLSDYPAITAWLARVSSLDGFQPMKA